MTSIKTGPKIVFKLEILILTTNTFLLLEYISHIYYLILFKNDQVKIKVLINSGIKINVMTLTYIKTLGLWI